MAALKELTVFKSLNSDGTNYHMSRPRCIKRAKKKNIINKMKNIINIWNSKVIWISQIVMINLLME